MNLAFIVFFILFALERTSSFFWHTIYKSIVIQLFVRFAASKLVRNFRKDWNNQKRSTERSINQTRSSSDRLALCVSSLIDLTSAFSFREIFTWIWDFPFFSVSIASIRLNCSRISSRAESRQAHSLSMWFSSLFTLLHFSSVVSSLLLSLFFIGFLLSFPLFRSRSHFL